MYTPGSKACKGKSNNDNNEIFIKREPLVYTRAQRAVQKKKEEENGEDSTTAITRSSMNSTPADTNYISLSLSLSHTHTHTHTH